MSQPPPYVPATSFISYQAQQSWFPGQQLDAEFNNLDTIIGDIEANLALIQRDDGALLNGIVTYDSLSTALQTSGLSGLTVWTSGVVFNEGQVVIDGAGIYTATGTHTSSASFAVDLAANWWELSSTIPTVAGANGVLSFARLAKTANYTLANTDKGTLVDLSGNALFTLTLNAASGYDANFAVIVHNADAGRGKVIAANGRTSFILWPHQTVVIFNDNNAWKFSPDVQPWVIPASTVFNVDNVNGSDVATNDGLGAQGTAGAFLTIQHTYNVLQKNILQVGAGVNIQLPTTTSTPITEQITVGGAMPAGIETTVIVGNTTTPTLCQWQIPTNGIAATISDYQSITFSGVGFSCSGTGGQFAAVDQHCIVDFGNCDFGANSGGVDIGAQQGARLNFLSGNSISGSCNQFLQISGLSSANMTPAFKIVGTPNVGTFINFFNGAEVFVNGLSFTGAGTISGQQFLGRWGGIISGDSAVSWPGTMSAGTCASGALSDSGISSTGSILFANLPSAPTVGQTAWITDSTTNTWGANISGSGSDPVLGVWNGSHWTVAGK